MPWQDIVFSVGVWIFIIALIPSLAGKDKPAISTSALTGLVLAVFAFAYFSLSLRVAALSAAILSLAWFVLAFQKWKLKTKSPATTEWE